MLASRHTTAHLRGAPVLLALLLLLAGCGTSTTPGASGPLTPVKVALDWTPNTNHTGIYAALAQGTYRANGLDVKLLPYSNSVSPEQLVATGQADFGISFTESVVAARAAGQPLVSIAAIIQHNTSALVSLKSSGLDTVASLAGKRYAGFGAPYEQPVISQVLTCGGASNPTFTNVTTSVGAIQALKSKQADFAWIFMGWEGIEAQRQGIALNVFPLTQYCIPDYYSPVIVTSEAFIKSHPAVIRSFLAATQKGYTFAIQHPQDAATQLIEGAPKGTFDDTQLVYDSQNYLSPRYAAGARCWGQQTAAAWTNYPRFMFEHQAIQDANGTPITTPPDYAAAFTNAFLPSC